MNKLHIIILITALIFAPTVAFAEFEGGGGSDTPKPVTGDTPVANEVQTLSVADFIKMERLKSPGDFKERVKAVVASEFKLYTLQGKIAGQLHGDLYRFKDETGSVVVEIEDFNGVKIGFDDLVRIEGEPDYDGGELLLDVKQLELVK